MALLFVLLISNISLGALDDKLLDNQKIYNIGISMDSQLIIFPNLQNVFSLLNQLKSLVWLI